MKRVPEILRHPTIDSKVERKEQTDEGINHKTNVARNGVVEEGHHET